MDADLILAPQAEHDIAEAYGWYEGTPDRLGRGIPWLPRCLIEVIRRTPEAFAKIHQNYRRGLLRRFPYAVFYEYAGDTVMVYCVFHTSQDPDKWRQRFP